VVEEAVALGGDGDVEVVEASRRCYVTARSSISWAHGRGNTAVAITKWLITDMEGFMPI
jgi:hypothetical protein